MRGPFHLKTERDVVPRGAVGVYHLASRQVGPIRYVGSNPDGGTLRARLRAHASEARYSWFWFEETVDQDEALTRECEEYHRYLGTIDNMVRPKFCRINGHR